MVQHRMKNRQRVSLFQTILNNLTEDPQHRWPGASPVCILMHKNKIKDLSYLELNPLIHLSMSINGSIPFFS